MITYFPYISIERAYNKEMMLLGAMFIMIHDAVTLFLPKGGKVRPTCARGVIVTTFNVRCVGFLFSKSYMILRPIARACPPLITRFFLVENFFEVACQDLSKDFIGIKAIGAVSKLMFQSLLKIGLLRPQWNLKISNKRSVIRKRDLV
jgi:hypothetical protein